MKRGVLYFVIATMLIFGESYLISIWQLEKWWSGATFFVSAFLIVFFLVSAILNISYAWSDKHRP